jgi:hypothetical protein
MVDARTGIQFTDAGVPLLDRVLTALRGDADASAVPESYLSGGGGDRLRRRAEWRFEQRQPEEFNVALARLRRLTVVCPGAGVRQHTEVPWRWTGVVPGVCDDDKPLLVIGGNLGELAGVMEAAVEWRALTRATLDGLRSSWGDSYTIWYADEQWQARRQDGYGELLCAPTPDGLYKVLTEDAAFCPVKLR